MHVRVIQQISQFKKLKKVWNKVYEQDSNAHVFVSWAWLHSFLKVTHAQWIVLVLYVKKECVAFLPLTYQTEKRGLIRKFHLGGFPLADYSGLLALPEYEELAVEAFSKYIIDELTWDILNMSDVMDSRLDGLLSHFSETDFEIVDDGETPCPYVKLPDQWSKYLGDYLSKSTRKHIRRDLRKVKALDDFRIVKINKNNQDRLISTLLDMWETHWQQPTDIYYELLYRCHENDCLWLQMFWSGTVPIAGLAGFIDPQRKTFSSYMGSYNPDFASVSPGRAMDAHGIQFAIENGYDFYDFLRGAERYKYSFGAEDRFTRSQTITRPSTKKLIIDKAAEVLDKFGLN